MTTIYLVRHGQASYGTANYDQLSAKGEQQAQYLGQYLAKIFQEQPQIVMGGMQRHQQTAQHTLKGNFTAITSLIDARWNEFNHEEVFKKFEQCPIQAEILQQFVDEKSLHPRKYLARIFKGAIARWVSGEHDDYSESWLDFQARIQSALDDLIQNVQHTKPKNVVVFTSGGVISVAVGTLLGLSIEKTFDLNWSVVNSSLTTLKVGSEHVQLVSFNEHHHIQAEKPELLTWI